MQLLRFIAGVLLLISTNHLLAQEIILEQDSSVFSFKFGTIEFAIDTKHGAKVSSLKFDGNEILISQKHSTNYIWGSTLWTAPQSEWGWPPPLQLDNGSYSARIDSNKLICKSPVELGMQFTKKYWINAVDTSINVNYFLKNMTSEPISKSLWEVTRMPTKGIVFWKTGEGGTWGKMAQLVDTIGSYSWLDLSKVHGGKQKLFADVGNGWFAHTDMQGRLFVRTFNDVNKSDFAKGEGEIEIYVDGKYMELENISKFQSINPENTMDYATKWYIRNLPLNINAKLGSPSLIKEVNELIRQQ